MHGFEAREWFEPLLLPPQRGGESGLSLLAVQQEVAIKVGADQRATQARSMIVKRRSSWKNSEAKRELSKESSLCFIFLYTAETAMKP
jgi:hypothetical protein